MTSPVEVRVVRAGWPSSVYVALDTHPHRAEVAPLFAPKPPEPACEHEWVFGTKSEVGPASYIYGRRCTKCGAWVDERLPRMPKPPEPKIVGHRLDRFTLNTEPVTAANHAGTFAIPPTEPAWTEEQRAAVLNADFLVLRPYTPGWTDACCAAENAALERAAKECAGAHWGGGALASDRIRSLKSRALGGIGPLYSTALDDQTRAPRARRQS